jgi:hypothetical protein
VSQQVSYEQYVVAEARRRDETDYRFNYWSYLGWNVLTIGVYSYYATYKLIERRTKHAERRLAFLSYFWHTLNARAEAAGKKAEVSEGLDNLSRIYQQIEAFERRNKREAILWTVLRLVFSPVGAYVNHFLNKDLIFFDEWESSYAANAEWVMQRIGSPVSIPKRAKPVPNRSTGLYVFLVIITLGLWSMVWRAQTMADGNDHFDSDDAIEDALLRALGLDQQMMPGGWVNPPGTPGTAGPAGPGVPPMSPGEMGGPGLRAGGGYIPPPDDPMRR